MAFAYAAIPARRALERHDWTAAMQLDLRQPAVFPWSDAFLYSDGITRFARALGAVPSGVRLGGTRLEGSTVLSSRLGGGESPLAVGRHGRVGTSTRLG